jgi:hypothetical protein
LSYTRAPADREVGDRRSAAKAQQVRVIKEVKTLKRQSRFAHVHKKASQSERFSRVLIDRNVRVNDLRAAAAQKGPPHSIIARLPSFTERRRKRSMGAALWL